MQRRLLGESGISVTDICMGTMTFGSQCDEPLSHAIMDRAYDAGIDFLDIAEMYPVPPKEEWFGRTEEIVGRWLKTKPREELIVATKVTGPGHGWFSPPVRGGKTALDALQINRAVDDSLRRLQTDYIDLYQTHWPDHHKRYEDTLAALGKLMDQGKLRAIGCSNETCWGLMKSLWSAEKHGVPRFDTVQNNFSLINRRCRERVSAGLPPRKCQPTSVLSVSGRRADWQVQRGAAGRSPLYRLSESWWPAATEHGSPIRERSPRWRQHAAWPSSPRISASPSQPWRWPGVANMTLLHRPLSAPPA